MTDIYQYPVFFECDSLRPEQIKKIKKYFSIRRKSGGKDCGPVRILDHNTYCVAFKYQTDQQEVLRRPEHAVDGLAFTVRGNLESCTPSPISSYTASQHPTSPALNPLPIPASAPPPEGEEYKLQLDSYLLRYLKECPKAEKELEKGLASVACSARLYLEEGRVVVRRLAQPGAADEVINWRAEVDKLFGGLQSCSSLQAQDEVRVHSKVECSQVNTRLMNVKGLSSKATEVHSSVITDPLEEERYIQNARREDELLNVAETLSSLTDVYTTVSYSLNDELQVLVCHGDITKLDADAIVNAANEDLDHCGGVAAALSKAGGPKIQWESNTLIQNIGKIPTGDVVVTTGGDLKCKKLLHVVGPVGGQAGGRERYLLKKAIHSALDRAEVMKFKSIAMPCISSGVFGVPVSVCSEAIVTAVKDFGSQGGRSLSRIILIDNRGEVVRAMKETCDRLLQGIDTGNRATSDLLQTDASTLDKAASEAPAGALGDGVHVEIIQGNIEAQQVEAIVSPMVGHDPLSTRVGSILHQMAGPQLAARFREEAREISMPGDAVLLEGLPGLPCDSVFFLNLVPWNDDQDGTPLEVLRFGIKEILTCCENRGFASVALPLLGAGIALRFPDSVVTRVLLEEVHEFKRNRNSRTPLLVRIVIYPSDKDSAEALKFDEALQLKEITEAVYQPDPASTPKRIILLGKTGSGKSSLANTIFEEKLFPTDHSPKSGTSVCQAETKSVNGRSITLIDTPGFFDVERPEEALKTEIVRCITECAPGPHAFLIVLKVEKFTAHEQAVFSKIYQCFSEEALKHAVIVFNHGDQLPKGMKIEEFVSQSKNLSDLVKKCGGRCHVFDNKHWNNKMQNNYRSNRFQVENLLNTIDKMVMESNGGYYVNGMLQAVEKEIHFEEDLIRQASANMPVEEIRRQAKTRVSNRFLIQLAGTATGSVLGALCGVAVMVGLLITAVQNSRTWLKVIKTIPLIDNAPKAVVAAVGGPEAAGLAAAGVAAGLCAAGLAAGGVMGGIAGCDAAEGAKTPYEAAEMAADAVFSKGKSCFKAVADGGLQKSIMFTSNRQ